MKKSNSNYENDDNQKNTVIEDMLEWLENKWLNS